MRKRVRVKGAPLTSHHSALYRWMPPTIHQRWKRARPVVSETQMLTVKEMPVLARKSSVGALGWMARRAGKRTTRGISPGMALQGS